MAAPSGYRGGMPEKVKRGLGLLVLAVACWIPGLAINNSDPDSSGLQALGNLLAIGMLLFGIAGLVFLVWGLLKRTPA